jgi:hypothetical protein
MILPYFQLQAFSVFQQKATMYVQEFQDDPEYMQVARTILDLCLADMNQMNHQYANPNQTMDTICHRVRLDLDNTLINESRFIRSLVRGFCCRGGVHRPWLEEMLNTYRVYVDM